MIFASLKSSYGGAAWNAQDDSSSTIDAGCVNEQGRRNTACNIFNTTTTDAYTDIRAKEDSTSTPELLEGAGDISDSALSTKFTKYDCQHLVPAKTAFAPSTASLRLYHSHASSEAIVEEAQQLDECRRQRNHQISAAAKRKLLLALAEDKECFRTYQKLLRERRVVTQEAAIEMTLNDPQVLERLSSLVQERNVEVSLEKQKEHGAIFVDDEVRRRNRGSGISRFSANANSFIRGLQSFLVMPTSDRNKKMNESEPTKVWNKKEIYNDKQKQNLHQQRERVQPIKTILEKNNSMYSSGECAVQQQATSQSEEHILYHSMPSISSFRDSGREMEEPTFRTSSSRRATNRTSRPLHQYPAECSNEKPKQASSEEEDKRNLWMARSFDYLKDDGNHNLLVDFSRLTKNDSDDSMKTDEASGSSNHSNNLALGALKEDEVFTKRRTTRSSFTFWDRKKEDEDTKTCNLPQEEVHKDVERTASVRNKKPWLSCKYANAA